MTAYWIGRAEVLDEVAYGAYSERAEAIIISYGGRYLARGGSNITMEGREFGRNVVIEFPSMQAALDCYKSKEYLAAWDCQDGHAVRDLCIVEGLPA